MSAHAAGPSLSSASSSPKKKKSKKSAAAASVTASLSNPTLQLPWFGLLTVEELSATDSDKWWTFTHASTGLIAAVAQYVCYTDWTQAAQQWTIAAVIIVAFPYGLAQGYHHSLPPLWQLLYNAAALLLHVPIIVAAFQTVDVSFRFCICVLLALWLFSVVWHAVVETGAVRVGLRCLVEVWYSFTFVHLIFRFVEVAPIPLLAVTAVFYVRLLFFTRALLCTEPLSDIDRFTLISRFVRGVAYTHDWWKPQPSKAQPLPLLPLMPLTMFSSERGATSAHSTPPADDATLSPQLPPSQALIRRPDSHEHAPPSTHTHSLAVQQSTAA